MSDMVQALVVSDTHGNRNALMHISRQFSDVPYVFHLGDYTKDAVWLSDRMLKSSVINVKGNCDWSSDCSEFEELTIKGQRIILTHGHTLNVKYGYDRALYYAQEHEAKALLFGHTHIPYVEYVDGVWLVNPGSAGEPRDAKGGSVVLMLIGSVGVVPKLLYLQNL